MITALSIWVKQSVEMRPQRVERNTRGCEVAVGWRVERNTRGCEVAVGW
jgi:hypothetical protein